VASDNQTRGNLPAKMNPTDTSSLSHITMADTRLHSAACKLEPGPNYGRTEGVRCKRFMRDEERFSGLDASFLRDETPLLTRHLFSPSPLSSTSSTPIPTVLPSPAPPRPAGQPVYTATPAATRTRRHHHHLRFQLCSLVCFSSSVWTGGDDGLWPRRRGRRTCERWRRARPRRGGSRSACGSSRPRRPRWRCSAGSSPSASTSSPTVRAARRDNNKNPTFRLLSSPELVGSPLSAFRVGMMQ
jgi:hypothetical protein